jgi:hypothetical protein
VPVSVPVPVPVPDGGLPVAVLCLMRMSTLIKGGVAGAVGVAVMDAAMKAATRALQKADAEPENLEAEPATARLGATLYRRVRGSDPDQETRQRLSSAIHWIYGAAMGSLYGLARGRRPGLDVRGGALFGVGLWILGDELAVPALGLSDPPTEHPPRDHAAPLAGHVAYGLATAAAAQGLARLTGRM